MPEALRIGVLVSILSLLTACAGRDFIRPSQEAFKLGQTTYSQVIAQMGQPPKTGEIIKNGKSVRTAMYVYATVGGESLEAGVIPARALGFYFHEYILVGQEFISSFRSDNSNFDETKIPAIVKGKTTRAEVIRLLGAPTATFIAPMVEKTYGEAIGYAYQATRGGAFSGMSSFFKTLRISFDENDKVADIEYVSTGSK